jgi:hypothetical protein
MAINLENKGDIFYFAPGDTFDLFTPITEKQVGKPGLM